MRPLHLARRYDTGTGHIATRVRDDGLRYVATFFGRETEQGEHRTLQGARFALRRMAQPTSEETQ